MQFLELGELYRSEFQSHLAGPWKSWKQNYLSFAEKVRAVKRDEWFTPKFQEYLWESTEVTGVGMGASVVIDTAFADTDVAGALWAAREKVLPDERIARGTSIEGTYEQVLGLITPKHNERRPSAKLVRVLAGIFPYDVLCLIDDHKTMTVRRGLGLKKHGELFLQQHLRVREELAKVTGMPKSMEDAIGASMLAWLIFERLAAAEEDDAGAPAEAAATPPGVQSQPAAPPLRLLPRDQQYKGTNHVKQAFSLMHLIVRDAENGVSRRELVANIQAEAAHLSAKSAGIQIGMAQHRFGLLETHDGDVLRPTALGRQLLEGESATNVLTPMLLRRVWGFAQLLDALRRSADGLDRSAIAEDLRKRYPTWTTGMTASGILEWCRDLELVGQSDGSGKQVFWLTDAGAQWAARLPPNLSDWDFPIEVSSTIDVTDSIDVELRAGSADHAVAFTPAPFDAVEERFAADPIAERLVLPRDLLRMLHGALHAVPHKRFVLLSGLSGSGKTSLAEAYARAYCGAAEAPPEKHARRVPVSPDWSDPSGLLGYMNPLGSEPTFEATAALELVLDAAGNPGKPFFLCLDEMNLARVEHYFAPFLSAMESAPAMLVLHGARDAIDNVPPAVPWPTNLFIIGTVNMDETTHAFSDKVLDRAFSFELWEIDLPSWKAKALARRSNPKRLEEVCETIFALHESLRPARRHFGYRTCDEILGFCDAVPGIAVADALDIAVLAKILPKVRGDDSGGLPAALESAERICRERALPRSADKVAAMRDSLRSLGVVRFSS